jgi:hypothetical protein
MMRLLAIVFSATFFAVVLAHEASALRGVGFRAGAVGVRGVSAGAYRGALRARILVGYRAAAGGGRRYWRRGRWYGYGAGLAALAGGYYGYSSYGYPDYGYPYYGYPAYRYRSARYRRVYPGAYGYSSGMGTSDSSDDSSGATAAKVKAAGPGLCGTYLYWKNGKCNDARAK